jgi:membrane protein required for colicin V production
MSLFDLAAGLVLVVSALVGWLRGAAREVATMAALAVAVTVAMIALPLTGPIARHAIHTLWLANIAAILVMFTAVYIVLRVASGAMTRRIHQTRGLGEVDRAIGAGFGVARALVILGLAYLTINAVMPPARMPPWISRATLYPLSAASGRSLKSLAPQGARLARQVGPMVGQAIGSSGDSLDDDGGARTGEGRAPARSYP